MKTLAFIIAGVLVGGLMAMLAVRAQQGPSPAAVAPAGAGNTAAAAPGPITPRVTTMDPAVLASLRAKLGPGAANTAAAAGPPNGKDRVPHAAPQAGVIPEMTIKEMANFQFDPQAGGGIPADVLALNGTTIRLRGFMLPLTQADAITSFALVPSLFSCCFGQPPGVEHTIRVTCEPNKAVPAVAEEIVVEGVLTVKEQREEGFTYSIFEMKATSVKMAPP